MDIKKIKIDLYRKIKIALGYKDCRDNLLSMLPKNAICAEIGAWEGDFSSRILKSTRPSQLYLIDPYRYYPEYDRAWFGNKDQKQEDMDKIYANVRSRFAKQIKAGVLDTIREESSKAATFFEDQYFDWIYVDGNHEYEFVLNDLQIYFQKVKTGGFLTGDDFGIEGWWNNGVTKAVNEFTRKHQDEIDNLQICESQFLIQKK